MSNIFNDYLPPVSKPPPEISKSQRFKKIFVQLGVIAGLVLVVFGGFIFVTQGSRGDTTEQIIAKVGKLVELPQGEEPTIATVTDLEPLQGQAFFAGAAVGDKVLIFSKSKKAILYRPSTNKIITVAPISQN